MRYVLYITTFLLSCTTLAPIQPTDGCDFSYLENKFYTEAERFRFTLIKRPIVFSFVEGDSIDCGSSKIAVGCAGNETIRFSKNYWQRSTCTSREILFFHEILHIHGRQHRPPPSLMQEYMLSDSEYLKDRDKFLQEVFKL